MAPIKPTLGIKIKFNTAEKPAKMKAMMKANLYSPAAVIP
jgi:hypothetical protein